MQYLLRVSLSAFLCLVFQYLRLRIRMSLSSRWMFELLWLGMAAAFSGKEVHQAFRQSMNFTFCMSRGLAAGLSSGYPKAMQYSSL